MATMTAHVQGPMAACLQQLPGLPPPDLNLPALEPVKNREVYRVRPDDELEEATWYNAEKPEILVEPSRIKLRSIHSKQASVVSFANRSPYHVRTLWIDFSGNEVVYSVLEPNTTRRYHTYQTHPWVVRELHSGTRMMISGHPAVVGFASQQTVEITAPPQLKWSLDTFSCFPQPYKLSVQGLLLAHKHMEQYAALDNYTEQACSPIQVSSSCSPAPMIPCSPRSTLLQQGSSPTSPKAPRLTICPVPASPRTARATTMASSPAGGGEPSTTTTSISISSEASHFKATVTVSSPTRAMLQQTVNIEFFNPVGGMSCPAAQLRVQQSPGGSVPQTHQTASCSQSAPSLSPNSASPPKPLGAFQRRQSRAKSGLFNNLVHGFKHVFRPKGVRCVPDITCSSIDDDGTCQPASTHITLHWSQMMSGVTTPATEPEALSGQWPPQGTHLGHLPMHLLIMIAEMAAPVAWQTLDQSPKGRPDIKPTLLACPPKTAEEEAAEHQEAAAADGDAAMGGFPPLI